MSLIQTLYLLNQTLTERLVLHIHSVYSNIKLAANKTAVLLPHLATKEVMVKKLQYSALTARGLLRHKEHRQKILSAGMKMGLLRDFRL
jgi:hypothetical protein